MKKTILLSVAATGIIFAGGDIAPAQPVAPAAAPAACDFWGSIGFRYDAKDNGTLKFSDKDNNKFITTVVLGVEKELGYGFGFGAEIAGTSKLGLKIADNPSKNEEAELSQFYLTYKNRNSAVKAGRFTLPKTLSPWAWTHTTLDRKDITFEGVLFVNTDLPDTTLVGAWIARSGDKANFSRVNGADNKGLFALGFENKSLKDTTLRATAYYITKPAKATSVWASAETKVNSVKLGLQTVYAKFDGKKSSFGVAGYVAGTLIDSLNAKLTLAYLNDGESTLKLANKSAFWGSSVDDEFGGNVVAGYKQKIAKLDFTYKVKNGGKVFFRTAVDKPNTGKTAWGVRTGYKFKLGKVNTVVEYMYIKNKDFSSRKDQRLRVEGIYKF